MGAVNDRDIKQGRKGDMWVSFKKNGIQRCRVNTVIQVTGEAGLGEGNGVVTWRDFRWMRCQS